MSKIVISWKYQSNVLNLFCKYSYSLELIYRYIDEYYTLKTKFYNVRLLYYFNWMPTYF